MSEEKIRYYVVKVGDDHAIWELTAPAMMARLDEDASLAYRMDIHPYHTRQEAEERRAELHSVLWGESPTWDRAS